MAVLGLESHSRVVHLHDSAPSGCGCSGFVASRQAQALLALGPRGKSHGESHESHPGAAERPGKNRARGALGAGLVVGSGLAFIGSGLAW